MAVVLEWTEYPVLLRPRRALKATHRGLLLKVEEGESWVAWSVEGWLDGMRLFHSGTVYSTTDVRRGQTAAVAAAERLADAGLGASPEVEA